MKRSADESSGMGETIHGRGQARAAVTACVALAMISLAPDARALSCAGPEELRAPRDGATDVPLDTLIWGGFPSSGVSLRGPDGIVAVEHRHIPMAGLGSRGTGMPVLIPLEPLLPNTTYTVEEESGANRSRQFTTGSAIDDAPPTPPALARSESAPGQLTLDFIVDDILAGELDPASAPFASIQDVLLPTNFGDGYHALDADIPVFRWLTQEATLKLSFGGPCSNWPLAGDPFSARFGAFDLAGNFSGWAEIPDQEVPAPDPTDRPPLDGVTTTPRPAASAPAEEGCNIGAASHASPWMTMVGLLGAIGLLRRSARAARRGAKSPRGERRAR